MTADDVSTQPPKLTQPPLLAVLTADAALLSGLAVQSDIIQRRPDRAGKTDTHVTRLLEIALNAHKRGGVTSGQLTAMEREVEHLRGVAI